MADLSVIKLPDNNIYNLKDASARSKLEYLNIAYAVCSDGGNVQNKTATIVGSGQFLLRVGAIVAIRYNNTNTYNSTATDYITLNVGGTGAVPIWYNETGKPTGTNDKIYGHANRTTYYIYDGSYYVFLSQGVYNTDTYTSAYCDSSGVSADKTATCTSYILLPDSYLHIIMVNNNSVSAELTLNVNEKGAKPIYINGEISSNINNVLPAGSYIVYYDGDNYYFRTDGQLTMPDIFQGDIDAIFLSGSSSSYSLLTSDPENFENGTISGDTGVNGASSTSRVRTVDYINLMSNYDTSIGVSSGYSFWVYKYGSDNTYLGYEPTNATQAYTLSYSHNISKIRLVIKKTDGTDFNASDVGDTWSVNVTAIA